MLVWVASYPRSGNTLTLLVLRDVFEVGGLGADFNDDLSLGRLPERGLPGSAPHPWNPPAELEGLTGDELLDALRQAPEPYFIKTHRVKRATDPAPALYLVRDGRDALVSHAHFVHDNDEPRFKDQSFDSRLATLIHPGIRAHGGWSGSVQAWRERSAPTATLRFEELVADPVEAVVAACAEIGVELPDPMRSPPSFDRLHEISPLIFRRGQVGTWRAEMAAELEARFWDVHAEQMRALGYGAADTHNSNTWVLEISFKGNGDEEWERAQAVVTELRERDERVGGRKGMFWRVDVPQTEASPEECMTGIEQALAHIDESAPSLLAVGLRD